MAAVETDDSIRDAETVSKWRKAVVRGIPFYLLVPRGLKESAQKMAGDAPVPLAVFMSTRLRRIYVRCSDPYLFNDFERFLG
jgi:hypothetical protein